MLQCCRSLAIWFGDIYIVYFFPAIINGIALKIFLAGIIHGAPECVGVVVGLAAAGVPVAE